ncbi:putative membrane protein [Corynebacterium simulans]|uniref:Membrane protein n=1 Tax=Corynebacterium simulans TaxID=146827 RepID=A0ABR5V691_9CORY|nr:putative membrane protein [Corynebacterium simulans]
MYRAASTPTARRRTLSAALSLPVIIPVTCVTLTNPMG